MLKKVRIGYESTTYINKELSHGDSLAKLLSLLNFNECELYTYLPDELDPDIELNYNLSLALTYGKSTQGIESILVNLILAHLNSLNHPCVILETLARIGDPLSSIKGIPYVSYKDEIYFFLDSNSDRETITNALTYCRSYPKIIALSFQSNEHIGLGKPISIESLGNLAARTVRLLIGAFDDESCLIWTWKHGNMV
jgi:hypothetical protein